MEGDFEITFEAPFTFSAELAIILIALPICRHMSVATDTGMRDFNNNDTLDVAVAPG